MNSKIVTVAMVFVMLSVGFAVFAADGSDAATDDRVAVNGTDNTEIAVNEGNYTHYEYTLTWKLYLGEYTASPSSPMTYTVTGGANTGNSDKWYVDSNGISDTEGDEDNFSIQLLRDTTDIGKYTIQVIGLSNTTDDITYTLSASITITIGGQSSTISDYAYYTRNVQVYTGDSNQEINATISGGAKVGSYYNQQITSDDIDVGNYDWYAVGLAPGLTMSADGYVSGIPTAAGTHDFKVYATDDDGNVYYDLLVGFSVNEKDHVTPATGFTWQVYDDGYLTGSNIIESGSQIVMKLFTTGDSPTEITRDATVKVVNTDANSPVIETIEYTEGQGYVLSSTSDPLEGSGAYRIQVTYGGVTDSFLIYIVGDASDISASIAIEGA